jgi:thiol-disulfide isomerase/thioredoxin
MKKAPLLVALAIVALTGTCWAQDGGAGGSSSRASATEKTVDEPLPDRLPKPRNIYKPAAAPAPVTRGETAFPGGTGILPGSTTFMQHKGGLSIDLNTVSKAKSAKATPLPTSKLITEVTDKNFDELVLNSPKPVFLYADISPCKPCDQQFPSVLAMARQYPNMRFVRMNSYASEETTKLLGIKSVPSQLIIKLDEKTIYGNQGLLDKASLKKLIDDGLAKKHH